MGKTSKFSFPLPGRKNRMNETSEDLALPEEPKLSKVERLLGTTDLPPQYQVPANKNAALLSRQPSSLTLNLYEPTITDGFSEFDTSSIPDVPAIPKSAISSLDVDSPWASQVSLAPPRSLSVSQVQSPRHYSEAPKRNHPRSQSSNDVFSVKHAELKPSTTNNGHSYTAIQLKPYASKIQELAHGPISPSKANKHKLFPVVETSLNDVQPTDNYPLSGFKPGAQAAHQKKRPTRLDLTKLLGRAASSSTPNLIRSVTSPTNTSINHNPPRFPSDVRSPSDATSPTPKISLSRRIAKKASIAGGRNSDQANRPKTAGSADEIKRSSKTSPRKSRASKHWFDGLLEAEDDVFSDHDNSNDDLEAKAAPYLLTHVEATASRPELRSYDSRTSPRKEQHIEDERIKAQDKSLNVPAAYSGAARCIRPVCSQRLDHIMQKQPSPLISDFCPDEVEEPTQIVGFSARPRAKTQLPDVRESVAFSETDESVTFGQAQVLQVRPAQNREAAVKVQAKRNTQTNQLRVVNVTRSNTVSREPSPNLAAKRAAQEANELQALTRGRSKSASARVSLHNAEAQQSDSKHKMMAVTAEEEALLAMMRQKRADMQSHSFAEGFKSALMSSPQSPMFQNIPHLLHHDSVGSNGRVNHNRPSRKSSMRSLKSPHLEQAALVESPMMAPMPTRMYRPRASTQTDLQPLAAFEAYERSTFPIAEGFSTTSETAGSIFNSSQSEKSIHSGTHSPVTPHSASASIQIAMSAMPWINAEFTEDMFQDSKHNSTDISPLKRSRISDGARSADVPLTADLSLVNDEEDDSFAPLPNTGHIIQQFNFRKQSASTAQRVPKSQPITSHLTARHHEHRHGCCGVTNTRCSVAVDVMDAWADLGGWQEQRHPLY